MKDYAANLNRYQQTPNGALFIADMQSRTTYVNDKSPVVNNVLQLKENAIHRRWHKADGVGAQYSTRSLNGKVGNFMDLGGYGPNYWFDAKDAWASATKEATDKAYSKVVNAQMKLWEYIAERNKMYAVLLRHVQKLKLVVEAIRKKSLEPIWKTIRYWDRIHRKYRIKKVLKYMTIPNLWLEFSFMWMPIVNDIKTLMNGLSPVKGTFTKGRASITYDDYKTSTSGFDPQITTGVKTRGKVRATVKLFVTIDDPLQALLHEVGLLNLSAPWDLAPFSFVVDWFVKVGSFLSRICQPGKTITAGSTTVLDDQTNTTFGWATGTRIVNRGSGYVIQQVEYRRTVGIPSKWFLTFGLPDSAWHVATSLSLLLQLLPHNLYR